MGCSARSATRERRIVSASWINYKDALPETGKPVLIIVDDEYEVGRLEEGPNGDLEWLYYDNFFSWSDTGRIQWWMPIPPKPENGK